MLLCTSALAIFTVYAYLRIVLGSSVAPLPTHRHEYADSTPDTGAKVGAVASESDICSKVGIDTFRVGGNAADALISTVFCNGVIGMYHSGIGGGGFVLVRASNGSYEFIDFREAAPAAAFEQMYDNNINASLIGGLSSGVPGELRGLEYLHKHYASLPWKQLMLPAIKIARYGFPVNEDLMSFITGPGLEFLTDDPSWAIDFAPNGTLVGLGDILTRKRYADTLETISEEGADAFYNGPIAEATINALQAANGTMTMADLRNYSVVIRKPVQIRYRDYKLTSGGAPSGGSAALSALKIVEGYPDFGQANTTNLSTHRLDEAFRFAFGERVNLGDPSFDPSIEPYQQEMLNATTAARIRSMISDEHTLNVSAYNPQGLEIIQTPGTSPVVTVDHEGMAIALTTSINDFFGSQIMVPETGVIPNDEMNDFSIPSVTDEFGQIPPPANLIRPGKRPLSGITPIIVEFWANSSLYFVAGGAGGTHIITSVVETVSHVLDQGLSAPEALAQPRFHDQLEPNLVEFDWAFDNSTVAFMQSRGHNCTWVFPYALDQAIRRLPNGTLEAATDPNLYNGGGYAI